MPTYYIDFEGGNDANDGLSFANRWKTFTNGATAARIAPGDTIRVMASPDPTLVGNATWTDGPKPETVAIASSTNATPIVITTSADHNLVTGDYVAIASHSTNTNANGIWQVGTVGSTTTFQILQIGGANTTGNGVGSGGTSQKSTNCIVKLASAVTQNVALCGGLGQKPAWTASTNVTATQNVSTYKEGYSAAQIAIAAGFTTGKAAYYTLPSTLDLSGFQQISFWVRQDAGTLNTDNFIYLALCSDTIGATVVNTINIPALRQLNTWSLVTVNLGSALGASIQSVALYVVTDVGAQTFVLDNIIACKAASSADSLTLASLVSKSSGTGDESWYSIQSINQNVVMIGNQTIGLPQSVRGYMGTTETVSTYKRQPINQGAGTTGLIYNPLNDDGTAANPIVYSGGWNRTDMSTQTGETWYDGVNGLGTGYQPVSVSYNRIDKLNAVRFSLGYSVSSQPIRGNSIGLGRFTACGTGINVQWCCVFDEIHANNNLTNINILGNGNKFTTIKNASNGSSPSFAGIYFNSGSNNVINTVVAAHNNLTRGVNFNTGAGNFIGSLTANGNTGSGVFNTTGYNNLVGSGSTTGNTSAGAINGNGQLYLNNFTINEATEVVSNGFYGIGFTYINRLDNTDNNSWVFLVQATINQQTAIVDSPATTAWKLLNNTQAYYTEFSPLRLKIGTIVCAANSLVTVTARMQREDTSLVTQLVCPGGQISGVPSAVSSNMTAASNTWETVTITFTPTKAGAVDIYAQCYGNNVAAYVCNLTASQA